MTTYNETAEAIAKTRLESADLTEGERNFMEGLISFHLKAARDVQYPVHPIKDVAVELGISKHQGAGFVSSLLKKNMIVMDGDLVIQNITDNEEIYRAMGL